MQHITQKSLEPSPLRYPGGKSKHRRRILPLIPSSFDEYREPCLGGGSVLVWLRQIFPKIPVWGNDAYKPLATFWQTLKSIPTELIARIQEIKDAWTDGDVLFKKLREALGNGSNDKLEIAMAFYVLNRISFSGTIESGGYSNESFEKRFTQARIDALGNFQQIFETGGGVNFTNLDFSEVINAPTDNSRKVFMFVDPPYKGVETSRLYGRKGDKHKGFDHEGLARCLTTSAHQWLLTYDDCEFVREKYKCFYIKTWTAQYGMKNAKKGGIQEGNELFIANYDIGQNLLTKKEKYGEQMTIFS